MAFAARQAENPAKPVERIPVDQPEERVLANADRRPHGASRIPQDLEVELQALVLLDEQAPVLPRQPSRPFEPPFPLPQENRRPGANPVPDADLADGRPRGDVREDPSLRFRSMNHDRANRESCGRHVPSDPGAEVGTSPFPSLRRLDYRNIRSDSTGN